MTRKQAMLRYEAEWLIFRKGKLRSLPAISFPHPKTASYCMCRGDLVITAGAWGCHKVKICTPFLFPQAKNCCFVSTVIFCSPWWNAGRFIGSCYLQRLSLEPVRLEGGSLLPVKTRWLGKKHFSYISGAPSLIFMPVWMLSLCEWQDVQLEGLQCKSDHPAAC